MNNLIINKSFKSFLCCKQDRHTEEMRRFLKNPDSAFDISDDLLMKNGNSATLVKYVIDHKVLVIKRYNMKTLGHALRRAFKKSRAYHSWHYAHLMKKKEINTPYPVAIKEKRLGVFRNKAFSICDYIEGPTAFHFFHDTQISYEQKSTIATKIINIFDKLKSSLISHGDMKATNIIIHNNQPYLLDLDSMKEHKSKYMFMRAWQKDIKRFMKNWDDLPEINQLFKQLQ